jgi:lipopolysaccharide/colanic/teichoic acid biosynthesis glycosyltransferase
MSWTWRRKTQRWQEHLDRLLDVVLAVLGTVLLAEVILLLT